MCRLNAIALLLYSLTVLPLCLSLPSFWLNPDSYVGNGPKPSSPPTCAAHPDKAYGAHDAPVQSKKILFTVSAKAAGPAVAKVCPGLTYIVKVELGIEQLALLTASQGDYLDNQDADCSGRAVYEDTSLGSLQNRLKVPCDAKGSLILKVTASGDSKDTYNQGSTNLTVDSTCTQKTCGAQQATPDKASSPLPTRNPSPALRNLERIAAVRQQMCDVPSQNASQCTASPLGYACSINVPEKPAFVIHWSVGGCPPTNPCTETYALRNDQVASTPQPMLHIAASYPTTGYVAVSLGARAGIMSNNDIVVGWVNEGHATVEAYRVDGYAVRVGAQYSGNSTFLVFSGGVEEGGATTICFSRPLAFSPARYSSSLSPNGTLQMNWAHGQEGQDGLLQHSSNARDGMTINLGSGQTTMKKKYDWVPTHALLMLVAWIYLAPTGIMFARYKQALMDKQLCGADVWFHLHRVVQLAVVGLFAAGGAIALLYLGSGSAWMGTIHSVLGKGLMGLVVLQLLSVFVRPKPDAQSRRKWNLFHWNLGRLCLFIGSLNVFVGINVYRRKMGHISLGWLVAALVGLLGLALVELLLYAVYTGRRREATRRQFDAL